MKTPYIAITDVNSADLARELLDVFTANLAPESKRLFAPGVMVSYKTLNNIPTKWKDVWPAVGQIGSILIGNRWMMNTIHYADYDGGNDLLQCLEKATKFGGPNLDALQLDMIWPSPYEVAGYRWHHPEIKVILQVGEKALERVSGPEEAVAKLKEYGRAIDYVLFDKSMGRGLGMDAEGLRPYLRAVRDSVMDVGLAVAGGLGPNTLYLVEPLVAEFPDLSIDAQGQLRPSGNAMDPIDRGMAKEYLEKAIKLLK